MVAQDTKLISIASIPLHGSYFPKGQRAQVRASKGSPTIETSRLRTKSTGNIVVQKGSRRNGCYTVGFTTPGVIGTQGVL